MRSAAVLPLLSAALVASQSISPDSVSLSLRTSWCTEQKTSCPLLCLQTSANSATTIANDCDPKTLSWDCVCKGGIVPNVTEYSLTVPFHECQEYGNQCVTACGLANNACANNCRTQNPCGAQSPTKVNATTSTSSSAATGTATSTGDSFNSLGGSSSSKGAASSLMQIGQLYGMGLAAAGLFAGFAFML